MFIFEEKRKGERLLVRYEGTLESVDVPSGEEGCPVTEIGSYAFAERGLKQLSIPETVGRVGRYAFYNCRQLESLKIPAGLMDFGAGAFTGCHRLSDITVDFGEESIGAPSGLRDVLMEVPEEITVHLWGRHEEARLIFPEYFEEGVENTPARIIEHHTHGSGMLYRNAFVHRCLNFPEYDGRFANALGQESVSFLVRLCVLRLRYPAALSESCGDMYRKYLNEHFEEALSLYRRENDASSIAFLMSLHRRQGLPARPSFDL